MQSNIAPAPTLSSNSVEPELCHRHIRGRASQREGSTDQADDRSLASWSSMLRVRRARMRSRAETRPPSSTGRGATVTDALPTIDDRSPARGNGRKLRHGRHRRQLLEIGVKRESREDCMREIVQFGHIGTWHRDPCETDALFIEEISTSSTRPDSVIAQPPTTIMSLASSSPVGRGSSSNPKMVGSISALTSRTDTTLVQTAMGGRCRASTPSRRCQSSSQRTA